ncbi:unnamed protein product [Schistocephalus solidus]|uniref:Transposase n=1 Tax=Schistocephalus solidus TaxID=70667 RepID=A0A183T143_SCHSO|nr:unnamed protein product [Schistocephalus solidus]
MRCLTGDHQGFWQDHKNWCRRTHYVYFRGTINVLQQQPTHFKATYLKMMESMMQQFSLHFPDPESSGKHTTSADAVTACIAEFIYDPDSGVTFDACSSIWMIFSAVNSPKPRMHGRKPPSACWQCGAQYFIRFYLFNKLVFKKCRKRGHKEDPCPAGRTSESKVCQRKTRRPKRPSSHFGPKSHSIRATFKTELEARRKYVTVIIHGKPVRLQLDTASDIILISKRTWYMIDWPQVITSNKNTLIVSGGILWLMSELECEIYFNGIQ